MLFPGIGVESSMGKNSPEDVAARLQLICESALPGAMLFNKTNIYSDSYCQVIKDFSGK